MKGLSFLGLCINRENPAGLIRTLFYLVYVCRFQSHVIFDSVVCIDGHFPVSRILLVMGLLSEISVENPVN